MKAAPRGTSVDLALSILDFHHPGGAVALAGAADELGFKRYWLGEHHSSFQCANPLLLGALLAGTTDRIRIGSGGVCLTFRNALQVAEDARLIEFMMPGRFDLGVTRGLRVTELMAKALLEGRTQGSAPEYAEKVRTLHGLVTGRRSPEDPLVAIEPYLENGPPLWVLGLSEDSARLAASLGVGFCYSIHHGSRENGPGVMRLYRESFMPSPEFPEPASLVVVPCLCAATEREAKSIEAELGLPASSTQKIIAGSAEYCADRFIEIAGEFATTEVMITDFQQGQDARLEMYRLLGKEFGLQ